MICQQTLERSTPRRRAIDKPTFVGSVTDLIVADRQSPGPRPQAFLVEQTPNRTLPTHRAGAGGLEVLVLQFPAVAADSFIDAMARPTD